MSEHKRYWLTAIVKSGAEPRITYSDKIWLKAYFDRHPDKKDPGEQKEGSGIRVPAEMTGLAPVPTNGEQRYDFELMPEEYETGDFKLYFWGEPYGTVALRKDGVMGGLAVGRLELTAKDSQKGGLANPPPNAMPGDEQILCEFKAVKSVVNFIVDEMNKNAGGPEMTKLKDMQQRWQNDWQRPAFRQSPGQTPDSYWGCLVHSHGGGLGDLLQNVLFCQPDQYSEGGIWDFKPYIATMWGHNNRLGNSGFLYFYDLWANIHYGYVGTLAGFTSGRLTFGADIAQLYDNITFQGDDPVDRQAIIAGINLAMGPSKKVAISDVISIVNRNPNWEITVRDPRK